MRAVLRWCVGVGLALGAMAGGLQAGVIFETTSVYHHIMVTDEGSMRTLYFDNAMESRMSLRDHLRGHFEYTEFFHLPWLWNERITNVLMIGLGGASVPRAIQHFHPQVNLETVELDPKVLAVARQYFFLRETPTCRVTLADGRQHLRRTRQKFDLIILDDYTANRYGSFIPFSLTTMEFFALASDHLTTNGVLAYNVIAPLRGSRKLDLVSAIRQTLGVVFPQVYEFHAVTSRNVVLVATRAGKAMSLQTLTAKADDLIERRVITVPGFRKNLDTFQSPPASSGDKSLILSDDYAPVNGLLDAEF